jgi:hypothetical protein
MAEEDGQLHTLGLLEQLRDQCKSLWGSELYFRVDKLLIDALLSALPVRTRRAVIDALESGGLLYGTEPQPGVVFDASGRLPNTQFDRALSDFDEPTRKQVTSVLSQVGALA